MFIDSFMGSKTAKITLSIALGVMFSHLLPGSLWEWVKDTGSWRQISKAITVLLGFPAVILLEKAYENIRGRQIMKLFQRGDLELAATEIRGLNATNPIFLDILSKELEKRGVVITRE